MTIAVTRRLDALQVKDAAGAWAPVLPLSGTPGSPGDVPTRQADGTYQDMPGGGAPADEASTDTLPLFFSPGTSSIIGPVPSAATVVDDDFLPWKRIPTSGQVRLSVIVTAAASAGAVLTVEAKAADVGATWQPIAQTTLAAPLDATGAVTTGWITLDPSAAGERQLRLVMSGGDGVTSVGLKAVWLEFSNGAPVCTEVFRENWDSYADLSALLAVYTSNVDTTDSGAGTWSLDGTHVLTGSQCLKLTVSGSATTGQVIALGRVVSGLEPDTVYTIRLWYWEEGTLAAGDPVGAWFLHSATATSDGDGNLTFGPVFYITDDGTTEAEMWVGAFIVERCP